MTEEKKPLKVIFAPGCFDSFKGTQEELQELIAEIHRKFAEGVPDGAVPLSDEETDEMIALLEQTKGRQ